MGVLYLKYERLAYDRSDLRQQVESDVKNIEGQLATLTAVAKRFKAELEQLVSAEVRTRRELILRDIRLAESLNIPLKKREVNADVFLFHFAERSRTLLHDSHHIPHDSKYLARSGQCAE